MTDAQYQREYQEALTREWRELPDSIRAEIPEHLREGLDRYILDRIRPGSFLCAVLSNDLAEAVNRANPQHSLLALSRVLQILYTWSPSRCWGSRENLERWLADRVSAPEGQQPCP